MVTSEGEMTQNKSNHDVFQAAIKKIEDKLLQSKQYDYAHTSQSSEAGKNRRTMELQFLLDLTKEQIQDENLNRSAR